VEFLILAVVLIAIGVLIVILRNRRPTGIDAGIADFEARRQALAPTPPTQQQQPAPQQPAPPQQPSPPSSEEREPDQRGRRSG
jgi:hypothetical protein